MRISLTPFENATMIGYIVPPILIALAMVRKGVEYPCRFPDGPAILNVFVEADPEWVMVNCHELWRTVRRKLITPMNLN